MIRAAEKASMGLEESRHFAGLDVVDGLGSGRVGQERSL